MQINSSCETFYSAVDSPRRLDSAGNRLADGSTPSTPKGFGSIREPELVLLPSSSEFPNLNIDTYVSSTITKSSGENYETDFEKTLKIPVISPLYSHSSYENDEVTLRNGNSLRLIKSKPHMLAKSNSFNATSGDGPVGKAPSINEIPKLDFDESLDFNNKASNSSLLSLESPRASLSFSPKDDLMAKRSYKRQKVIEELIESEESYINSLNMLLVSYIEPIVDLNPNSCGVPVILIESYIRLLLLHHEDLIHKLRKIMKDNSINSIYSPSMIIPNTYTLVSDLHLPSPYVAAIVSTLISKKGISALLYEEYCTVYEDVLFIVKNANSDSGTLNESWAKGCENFLETTQPSGRHQDLSFMSLIQKPVSRISKYRLILESLLKFTTSTDDELCFDVIQSNIESIRHDLSEINDNYKNSKTKDKTKKLFSLINFSPCSLRFPPELFGKNILTGALVGIWHELNEVRHLLFGGFLFKSHLILADCSKNSKFEPKFVIPLVCCKILDVGIGDSNGLYTLYPYTLKLIFENNFCIFEILLSFLSLKEYNIWRDELQLLINFVNGPYKLDFTFSKMNKHQKLTMMTPNMIDPMETCVERCNQKVISRCYFSRVITVRLLHFKSFQILDQNYLDQEKFGKYESTIEIKKYERLNCETNLKDVYSAELPFFCIKRDDDSSSKLTKNPDLKKTGSWTSLRVASLRSFKGSNIDDVASNSRSSDTCETNEENSAKETKHEESPSLPKMSRSESQIDVVRQTVSSSDNRLKRNTATSGSIFRKLMGGLFDTNRAVTGNTDK